MMPTTELRLDQLALRNYRCFSKCTVDLHPQLTVLVAENGRGKTAVLDAIGIAFGLFVDIVSDTRKNADFESTDVRLVQGETSTMNPMLPTEFVADGYVGGQLIRWSRALKGNSPRNRSTTKDTNDLRNIAQRLSERIERISAVEAGETPILPLVASYGTNRQWGEQSQNNGKRSLTPTHFGRMSGYSGCLSASSSMRDLVLWFEDTANKIQDSRFSSELFKNLSQISAVVEATKIVLEPTGWNLLSWDYTKKTLVVEHRDQGRLPLSTLSDGVRNTVALVADIARRCASLNPHLREEAAQKTPGVLLIDEVDMHLHPGWQQQVIELLCRAFPSMQLILSTHSPHVLSTVDRKSIRMIQFNDGEGLLETPLHQTRGVESADVLASIMGVDPIPQIEEAQWLSNYRAMIQQHLLDSPDAIDLRTRLEAHFGIQHPVILECDRIIRLERFKQSLPAPANQGRG